MVQSFFISLARALSRSRFFSAPLVVVAIGSMVLMAGEYLTRVRFEAPAIVAYGLYWMLVVSTLSLVAGAAADRLRHENDRLLASSFVAGVLLGLAVALFKAGVHHELWTLFNLLAEPMRTGLVGLVIGWLFVMNARAGGRRFAV